METKPLLYGLIGFFIGGLVVSVAATTFESRDAISTHSPLSIKSMTMGDMMAELKHKTGDDFDKAFIASMIAHHEGAIEMAKLSASNAKHEEIKQLSSEIIAAQEREINEMEKWRMQWRYSTETGARRSMH